MRGGDGPLTLWQPLQRHRGPVGNENLRQHSRMAAAEQRTKPRLCSDLSPVGCLKEPAVLVLLLTPPPPQLQKWSFSASSEFAST